MLSISLVTPSLNQREYIEQTLESVLAQGYDGLEYVVADGGSTDGSVAVIKRYADRLAGWWSDPDDGHAAALNRAFARTGGEIMGWLNSDDILFPGALHVVGEIFETLPQVAWLTAAYHAWLDERGRVVAVGHTPGYHREAFQLGLHGVVDRGRRYAFITQESTFWRRSLWARAGGRLDVAAEPAADFELWARFFDHAELHAVDTAFAAFRIHELQRSALERDEYRRRALAVLAARGAGPPRRLGGLAVHARAALPPRLVRRLRLGWDVPYVRWQRDTASWRAGRRALT